MELVFSYSKKTIDFTKGYVGTDNTLLTSIESKLDEIEKKLLTLNPPLELKKGLDHYLPPSEEDEFEDCTDGEEEDEGESYKSVLNTASKRFKARALSKLRDLKPRLTPVFHVDLINYSQIMDTKDFLVEKTKTKYQDTKSQITETKDYLVEKTKTKYEDTKDYLTKKGRETKIIDKYESTRAFLSEKSDLFWKEYSQLDHTHGVYNLLISCYKRLGEKRSEKVVTNQNEEEEKKKVVEEVEDEKPVNFPPPPPTSSPVKEEVKTQEEVVEVDKKVVKANKKLPIPAVLKDSIKKKSKKSKKKHLPKPVRRGSFEIEGASSS